MRSKRAAAAVAMAVGVVACVAPTAASAAQASPPSLTTATAALRGVENVAGGDAVRTRAGARAKADAATPLAVSSSAVPGRVDIAAPSGGAAAVSPAEGPPPLSEAPPVESASQASPGAIAAVRPAALTDGPPDARAPSTAIETVLSDAEDARLRPEVSAVPDGLSQAATADAAGVADAPRAARSGAEARTSATDDIAAAKSALGTGGGDLTTASAPAPESGHNAAIGALASPGDVWHATPLAAVGGQAASAMAPIDAAAGLPQEVSLPLHDAASVSDTWLAQVLSPPSVELTGALYQAALGSSVAETVRATHGAGWLLSHLALALGCSLKAAACAEGHGRSVVLSALPDVARNFVLSPRVRAARPLSEPASADAIARPAWSPVPAHLIRLSDDTATENGGQDRSGRSPQGSPIPKSYATTFAHVAHISSVTAAAPVLPFQTDVGGGERQPDESPPAGATSGTAGSASAQAPPGASSSALALTVAVALAAPYLLTTLELAVTRRRPLLLGPRLERPG